MGETLSIRLRDGEKTELEKAAASARETVANFVRTAVRQRIESSSRSPWEKHLGSVSRAVVSPTNENVRRSMNRARRQS